MTEREIRLAVKDGFLGAAFWIGVGIIVVSIAVSCFTPYDDTDDGKQRSGLKVRTDALTGCQYLVAQEGGVTPRMSSTGHHICIEPKP